MKASCCDWGREHIESIEGFMPETTSWEVEGTEGAWGFNLEVNFCPQCGANLNAPNDLPSLLNAIESYKGSRKEMCFDVDGVIAKGGHPYAECTPYPIGVAVVRKLKECGHKIKFFTSRYMRKHDENRQKSHESGWLELRTWLDENEIPYDEIILGKPSYSMIVDDRGCRVLSEHGLRDWGHNFLSVFLNDEEHY